MRVSLSPEQIEKTLQGIVIPSRPQVLSQLERELRRDDPSPRIVGRLISADVSLSAAVLKMINSPALGVSRRISSVDQAVSLLGMSSVSRLVTGLALKMAVAGKAASLDRFWDSAEDVAGIASRIALTIPRGPRDDAYCFGLFRDVGIPLLMQKLPTFRQTLMLADGVTDRPCTAVEQEQHATDHATVSYLVAKSWFLPTDICSGILHHHDPAIFDEPGTVGAPALTLIGINAVAEHFHDEYVRMRPNNAWGLIGDRALGHLGLDASDYRDLREDIVAAC